MTDQDKEWATLAFLVSRNGQRAQPLCHPKGDREAPQWTRADAPDLAAANLRSARSWRCENLQERSWRQRFETANRERQQPLDFPVMACGGVSFPSGCDLLACVSCLAVLGLDQRLFLSVTRRRGHRGAAKSKICGFGSRFC